MGESAIVMNRPLTLTLPLGGGRENTLWAITQNPSPGAPIALPTAMGHGEGGGEEETG